MNHSNIQNDMCTVTLYEDNAIEYYKDKLDKRVENLKRVVNEQTINLYLEVHHDACNKRQLIGTHKRLQSIYEQLVQVSCACEQLFQVYMGNIDQR